MLLSLDTAQLITVALYVVTILSWAVVHIAPSRTVAIGTEKEPQEDFGGQSRGRSLTWPLIGLALLVILAADRYFWFSHVVADQIRELAHQQGWYHRRRKLQAFVLACTATGLVASVLLWRRFARSQTSSTLSMSCVLLGLLLVFCFVRAMSNHYVDRVLVYPVLGLRLHWLVEWSLLITLLFSLGRELRLARK
jgi:hypothetical protein